MGTRLATRPPARVFDYMARQLSDRQLEIVRRIARGQQMREIAEEMGIAYNTVDSHRQAAMNKLGIHTSVGLTHWAIMAGLVELGDVIEAEDDRHAGIERAAKLILALEDDKEPAQAGRS